MSTGPCNGCKSRFVCAETGFCTPVPQPVPEKAATGCLTSLCPHCMTPDHCWLQAYCNSPMQLKDRLPAPGSSFGRYNCQGQAVRDNRASIRATPDFDRIRADFERLCPMYDFACDSYGYKDEETRYAYRGFRTARLNP